MVDAQQKLWHYQASVAAVEGTRKTKTKQGREDRRGSVLPCVAGDLCHQLMVTGHHQLFPTECCTEGSGPCAFCFLAAVP